VRQKSNQPARQAKTLGKDDMTEQKIFYKDVRLCLEEAEAMSFPM
jgi:hypothetical protein